MTSRRRRLLGGLPARVLLCLGLVVLIKALVAQPFYIPSGSMEPTLDAGDRVLVDQLSYRFSDVRRGDLVVFDGAGSWVPDDGSPAHGNLLRRSVRGVAAAAGLARPATTVFVKRVVGLPGEHVACCNDNGWVTVDGRALDERSYLAPGDAPSELTFEVVVPAGRLFVLGDHRSDSADSRAHLNAVGGTVPVDRVIGRAVMVLWPLAKVGSLGRPDNLEAAALVLLPSGRRRLHSGSPSGRMTG